MELLPAGPSVKHRPGRLTGAPAGSSRPVPAAAPPSPPPLAPLLAAQREELRERAHSDAFSQTAAGRAETAAGGLTLRPFPHTDFTT